MKVFCEECSAGNVFTGGNKPTIVEVDTDNVIKNTVVVSIIGGVKKYDTFDCYRCQEGHLIDKEFADLTVTVISPEDMQQAADFGVACAEAVASGLKFMGKATNDEQAGD